MSTTPAPRRSRRFGINVPLAYTTAYTVFGARLRRRDARSPTMPARSRRSPCRRRKAASSTRRSRRRRLAPRHRPDAARRRVRLPAPGIPDRVPAEGTSCLWNLNCAAQTKRGERRQATASRWPSPATGGTGARPTRTGFGDRLPERRARHAGRDHRDADAADLLAQGVPPRQRRRRPHRGGLGQIIEIESGDAGTLRDPRRLRPHRQPAARPRRRPRRRGRLCRPQIRPEDEGQGLPGDPAGRPHGRADAGRRRHRRARRARPGADRARRRRRPDLAGDGTGGLRLHSAAAAE